MNQSDLTPPQNRLELLAYLINHCEDCPLSRTRTNAVPGSGPPDARIIMVAEGPGKNEDLKGQPFVGPAGKFLDELLPLAGLTRNQVFITNMIKCRAPENRDPTPEELQACDHHLELQLATLQPTLIIALGKFSLQKFLPGETIGKAAGRLRRQNGRFIYPIMHPAAGLRRTEFKERIIEHFKGIPEALRQIEEDPPPDEPMPTLTKKSLAKPTQPAQASLL